MDGKASVIRAWDQRYVQQQGARGVVRTITATLVSSRVVPASTPSRSRPPPTRWAPTSTLCAHCSRAMRASIYSESSCMTQAPAPKPMHAARVPSVCATSCSSTRPSRPSSPRLAASSAASASTSSSSPISTSGYAIDSASRAGSRVSSTGATSARSSTCTAKHARPAASEGVAIATSSPAWRPSPSSPRAPHQSSLGGREHNNHHTFDTALAEDARPWFHEHPVGALDVIILRRIAYNAMALFRARTLRADAHHLMPWRALTRQVLIALISATEAAVIGLRARAPP